jgi:hypothetical protein
MIIYGTGADDERVGAAAIKTHMQSGFLIFNSEPGVG